MSQLEQDVCGGEARGAATHHHEVLLRLVGELAVGPGQVVSRGAPHSQHVLRHAVVVSWEKSILCSPCSIGFYSIWQIFLHSLLTHPLYSPIWSAPVEAMVRRKFANRQSLMLIVQVKFNKEGLNASTKNKNLIEMNDLLCSLNWNRINVWCFSDVLILLLFEVNLFFKHHNKILNLFI